MIRLSQWMCPARHCIFALSWDDQTDMNQEKIEKAGQTYIDMHPEGEWRCGLCDSEEIAVEHGKTRFTTMKEAQPYLEEEQNKQMMTRFLEDMAKERLR